ncbi:winged helix DNA-binding domain-containing protein [Gordonia sp. (in: high G+C Gram-positive bacteria)]|uniref:winged helix DNA-binding domain-containing protein n=3 Tax=Gordonia sp. (in: high G+C Gram-positive bacteria) TaxID=84139 RepID=UPI003C761D93
MTDRPVITDDQRRAALQQRLLLDDTTGHSVIEVADAVVGLHATIPSTVHLSAWARGIADGPEPVEAALYRDRAVVKQLAMRRTLFVMSRPVLAEAVGAVGSRVAASERTNMLRDLRRSDDVSDPEAWLVAAHDAVLAEFGDGAAFSASELRKRLPDFDIEVMISPGKSYGGLSPLLPRMLNFMAAAGEVVRGPNDAAWHRSRPSWTAMATWLGEPLPHVDPHAGHIALVERWLRQYGPGTETDLVWWLGTTKSAVRKALAALDVREADLSNGVGYLLADDPLLDGAVDAVEPRALLLPTLDPATMGWKERDFYLGEHAPELFDRNGNGGQTAWWDGRIVGGWVLDDNGVRVVPLEDLSADAVVALNARAAELTDWLGDHRPTSSFPSPLMRRG